MSRRLKPRPIIRLARIKAKRVARAIKAAIGDNFPVCLYGARASFR